MAVLAILMVREGAGQAPGFTTIFNFSGADGFQPQGAMIVGPDGSLYGTTYGGGFGSGTIFQLTPAGSSWTETVLDSLDSDNHGFYTNVGGLVSDSSGALYTTPEFGGEGKGGGVIQLTPPAVPGGVWTETDIHSFNARRPDEQSAPNGPLLYFPDGSLYGTVFSKETTALYLLRPPDGSTGHWREQTLFTFPPAMGFGSYDGVISHGGNFYGATYYSSPSSAVDCGSVFEIMPGVDGGAWTGTAIHIFAGGPGDGCKSWAVLAVDANGSLYGTTSYGGSGPCGAGTLAPGCGTVFQLNPPATPGGPWTEAILYSFTGASEGNDGAFPIGGVVMASNGSLYGATQSGGVGCKGGGCGTVFQLTPPPTAGGAWTEKVLHRFDGTDGESPVAQPTLSRTGVLFGTTSAGGRAGGGTVYSIAPE